MGAESPDLLPAGEAVAGLRVRVMQVEDEPVVSVLSGVALDLDMGDATVADRWRLRVLHPLNTDPLGAFVAERDGDLVGVAQAMCRERLWCLSLLAVAPGGQSGGVGRALLQRSLTYAADSDAGLIVSSSDPRAWRLYALAGFALWPTFDAVGEVDRRLLRRPDARVRDGGEADLEALAEISREIRGAAQTAELQYALDGGARLLRLADRGFAVASPVHGVWLLVARDDDAASALLWSALAAVGDCGRPPLRWITAQQQWAIDVALRAGLQLAAHGALCVRGRPGPLRPFLPSGPFA